MLDKIIQAGLGDVFEACSVQVLHRGDEWLSGAWGVIDPDACAQPVTRETLFDLASVTKLFTVSAFLSLVGEGRVALDDPLVSVLPEFDGEPRPITGGKNPHTLEPNEPPGELAGQTVSPGEVTFRHLLTHTSGLAPWVDVYNAAGKPPSAPTIPGDLPRVTRWARAQAVLARAPFVDAVGANVHYSDLGLMLLAWAVERLGDYPLEQAIDERVTGPLGLKRVTFNPLQHGYEREDTVATEYDTRWRERRVWGEVHDENACGLGGWRVMRGCSARRGMWRGSGRRGARTMTG